MEFVPTAAASMSFAPPKVVSISPAEGFSSNGGDAVTIYGQGFGPASVSGISRRVLIGGVDCQVAVTPVSDAEGTARPSLAIRARLSLARVDHTAAPFPTRARASTVCVDACRSRA